MTLPEVIYCQGCYSDGQRTPAAWASPDPKNPKKADFYCIRCLTKEGIDIADCETLGAWRTMVVDAAKPTAPADTSAETCDCGRPNKHRGRCRGKKLETRPKRIVDKRTVYTEEGHEVKAPAPERSKPNGHTEVGGFKVRLITLEEYRAEGCREKLSDLDPVVAYVRTMKVGTVSLWNAPKGKALKWFRERLGRALQKAHKLPVRIEMRKADNAIAVIREAQ